MSRFLTTKDFGNYSLKDGKLKTWKRSKDASQKQRWKNSKKIRAVSPRMAAKLSRP